MCNGCVQVVLDVDNNALYFSRALIPHNKKGAYNPEHKYWRKLGIYSYKASFLPKYLQMPTSLLQDTEDLEQNKVILFWYTLVQFSPFPPSNFQDSES